MNEQFWDYTRINEIFQNYDFRIDKVYSWSEVYLKKCSETFRKGNCITCKINEQCWEYTGRMIEYEQCHEKL